MCDSGFKGDSCECQINKQCDYVNGMECNGGTCLECGKCLCNETAGWSGSSCSTCNKPVCRDPCSFIDDCTVCVGAIRTDWLGREVTCTFCPAYSQDGNCVDSSKAAAKCRGDQQAHTAAECVVPNNELVSRTVVVASAATLVAVLGAGLAGVFIFRAAVVCSVDQVM